MSARILVVDDDPKVLDTLDRVLTGAGYLVTTALDGAKALELARSAAPDLVLSDLDMPIMTGLQLLVELKASPTLDSTPVLILTAQADPSLHQRVFQAGAEGLLIKPSSLSEILKAVLDALAS